MKDIREELARLREKLRRLEERGSESAAAKPPGSDAPVHQTPSELPPWDTPSSEDAFEASMSGGIVRQPSVPANLTSGDIDSCLSGRVVETSKGSHFEVETLFPCQDRHGNFDIGELPGTPEHLIAPLCPEHGGEPIGQWAFLDTETTGLSGGTGTLAFLIGIGFVTSEGFLVRQYFLREPKEEQSVLQRVADDLAGFRTLITFNGRTFDAPLLETRYRLARAPIPFEEMPHLDLLHSCRRLWKLRFESCKLTFLEQQILGHERVGDVPGFLIPALYTNYLRTREAGSLVPVFQHNALDILSLACLATVVAGVFSDPANYRFRHGSECIGLGRWLLQAGRRDEALVLLRKGANAAIPEDLLARTLWDIAQIERRDGRYSDAHAALEQLVGFPNVLHAKALEALSILHELRLKDPVRALHYARRLEQVDPSEKTGARIERLVRKLTKGKRNQMFGPADQI